MDPTSFGDDLPVDLVTYLERRLGLGRAAALAMLGEWLVSYEPVRKRARLDVPASEPALAS